MVKAVLILIGVCCVLSGGCVTSEEEHPAGSGVVEQPAAAPAATGRQKQVAAIKQRMRSDRAQLRQLQNPGKSDNPDSAAAPETPENPTPAE